MPPAAATYWLCQYHQPPTIMPTSMARATKRYVVRWCFLYHKLQRLPRAVTLSKRPIDGENAGILAAVEIYLNDQALKRTMTNDDRPKTIPRPMVALKISLSAPRRVR